MKITLAVATSRSGAGHCPAPRSSQGPKRQDGPKASTFRSDRTATAIIATITTGNVANRDVTVASVRAASEVGPGERCRTVTTTWKGRTAAA